MDYTKEIDFILSRFDFKLDSPKKYQYHLNKMFCTLSSLGIDPRVLVAGSKKGLESLDVENSNKGDKDELGSFDHVKFKIVLNGNSINDPATYIHEILHALSLKQYVIKNKEYDGELKEYFLTDDLFNDMLFSPENLQSKTYESHVGFSGFLINRALPPSRSDLYEDFRIAYEKSLNAYYKQMKNALKEKNNQKQLDKETQILLYSQARRLAVHDVNEYFYNHRIDPQKLFVFTDYEQFEGINEGVTELLTSLCVLPNQSYSLELGSYAFYVKLAECLLKSFGKELIQEYFYGDINTFLEKNGLSFNKMYALDKKMRKLANQSDIIAPSICEKQMVSICGYVTRLFEKKIKELSQKSSLPMFDKIGCTIQAYYDFARSYPAMYAFSRKNANECMEKLFESFARTISFIAKKSNNVIETEKFRELFIKNVKKINLLWSDTLAVSDADLRFDEYKKDTKQEYFSPNSFTHGSEIPWFFQRFGVLKDQLLSRDMPADIGCTKEEIDNYNPTEFEKILPNFKPTPLTREELFPHLKSQPQPKQRAVSAKKPSVSKSVVTNKE